MSYRLPTAWPAVRKDRADPTMGLRIDLEVERARSAESGRHGTARGGVWRAGSDDGASGLPHCGLCACGDRLRRE